MANLGTVTSELIEQMLVEFADRISTTESVTGNYDSTERLLLKVMDKDKVSGIMEEIRGPAGRTMWDKLANVNEMVLANYLKNEYPQTVRSEEHTSELQSLMRTSYAVFCLKKKKTQ